MPKVSIIVPVCNTEKYLKKCLHSLTHQTLRDIEIICINDGSTDDSSTFLNQYANQDKRIKIIDFTDHQGVSAARNAGIRSACGEYIAFVDSDDFVDLDFYEKLYAKAKETGADIVKGDLKEIFPDGKELTYDVNKAVLDYKNKVCFYIAFTSAIYRLERLKKARCFFEPKLIHSEDLVWLNRMVIAANSVEIISDTFYYYIRRENSSDTQVLPEKNVYSAYVGWKHMFLNTKAFAQNSDLDFSFCYQRYFQVVLAFIFRSSKFEYRLFFCKLLFFFYHCCPHFYDQYLTKDFPSLHSFFKENKLNEFADFMKDKHLHSNLILARLRYNIWQKKLNEMPLLSIIIPIYNVQEYLKKCLDSICHQTYKNLEIICVDDCSKDNSLKILKEFAEKDSRFKIVRRIENGGQAAARQTGIDVAIGDYIGFVDSDDWVDADYYEKMFDCIKWGQTDILINGNILVHEGKEVYPKNFPGHKQLKSRMYDNPSQLIDKVFCVVWNKLFRTEFLKERKYIIPVRSAHEDFFFHYATFAFAKNISFFNGPAYHYLYRNESISNQKHDWGVEHIKVFSQLYDFYRGNNLLDKKIKLYATMPFFDIKNEEAFEEYKKYFTKIQDYIGQNKDLFNDLDLFFVQSVLECENYPEYISKYPGRTPLMTFLRRKMNK